MKESRSEGYTFDGQRPLKWTPGKEREEYIAEMVKVDEMVNQIKNAGTLARAEKMIEVFNASYHDPEDLEGVLADPPTLVRIPQGEFVLDDNGTEKNYKLTLHKEKNSRTRSFKLHLVSDEFDEERATKLALDELRK